MENTDTQNDIIAIQDSSITENVETTSSLQDGFTSLIPMLLIFIVFYFLLIRPQEKKRRTQENLVSGVKKGEEILTNSGVFGVVTDINDSDNTVIVRVAKDVEIKMQKNSIADITSRNNSSSDKNKDAHSKPDAHNKNKKKAFNSKGK